MSTVNLLLNTYNGDDYNPSRQLSFMITEECLSDYLKDTEDDRTIEEFLDTYDSDESSVIYEYATDDGRVISEKITYSDAFENDYNVEAENEMSKEDYFWNVFYK